jgi:hypothetical protein
MRAPGAILEYSALLAVRIRDTAAFERYLSQLQPFWSLPAAKDSLRPTLTGLHLLLLLSRNEIGAFHTQLERLTSSHHPEEAALMQSPLVQFVTELETWLMEGSFSKIWQARNSPPVDAYRPFLDDLMKTVRSVCAWPSSFELTGCVKDGDCFVRRDGLCFLASGGRCYPPLLYRNEGPDGLCGRGRLGLHLRKRC